MRSDGGRFIISCTAVDDLVDFAGDLRDVLMGIGLVDLERSRIKLGLYISGNLRDVLMEKALRMEKGLADLDRSGIKLGYDTDGIRYPALY